jgi:hypothetical protein
VLVTTRMAAQRSSPYTPRAGCSLCTIITNLRSNATSSGSSESTPVDIQHAYRTPWATSPSPGPASPTPTTPHEQPSPTSPTAHAPLTSPSTSTSTSSRKVAGERRAIYTDSDLTVWPALSGRAGEALASGERHLVLAFNVHVESVYQFVSPLLESAHFFIPLSSSFLWPRRVSYCHVEADRPIIALRIRAALTCRF